MICKICHHSIDDHNMDDRYSFNKACYHGLPLVDCYCSKYERDNLKYLEMKATGEM